jgi:membrane associated rhomboid family serine protease
MTSDAAPPDLRQPFFSLTLALVAAVAILIVALHGLTYLLSYEENVTLLYDFGLAPRRFFAPSGSEHAYPNILAQLFTLVSTALLHGDWIHVGLNALTLWQFGRAPALVLGSGPAGAGKWLLLFIVSVAGGSLVYLLFQGVEGGVAVGASGGVCGLIAADFLVESKDRLRSPVSRQFLMLTLGFALVNALLVFIIPLVLPFYVAWEAHLGGYVAGVAVMLALGPKARAAKIA